MKKKLRVKILEVISFSFLCREELEIFLGKRGSSLKFTIRFLFYFILFYFILFYFILFYFILFYFILFYFISFYFILFHFISFYFILFYFISFCCCC